MIDDDLLGAEFLLLSQEHIGFARQRAELVGDIARRLQYRCGCQVADWAGAGDLECRSKPARRSFLVRSRSSRCLRDSSAASLYSGLLPSSPISDM